MRRIGVLHLSDVARNGESPPADCDAEVVAGRVSALTAAVGADASASRSPAWSAARIATRTCDGRPLAGAGVNLKSVSDSALPANAAASLGSALAGVKEEIGSKLSETAAGCFLVTCCRDRRRQHETARGECRQQLGFLPMRELQHNDELPVHESI